MIGLFCFVLAVLASPFKSKLRLEAKNAVLRHQLNVLRRRLHGRVRLTNNDRWFFIQLYRWVPSILQVLTIIRSDQNRPTLHAEFNGIGGPRTYIGMVLVPPPALLSFGPSFHAQAGAVSLLPTRAVQPR